MIINYSRVVMRAKRAMKAWNNLMEEVDQVVMESDGEYCARLKHRLDELFRVASDDICAAALAGAGRKGAR